MSFGRDALAGLICLTISLVLLVQSFGLPHFALVPVGPGFYPRIVLVFMAAVSGLLIVQDLRARRSAERRRAEAAEPRPLAYGLVAVSFAIVGAYIVFLPLVGYRIATVLFVAALQTALERPRTPLHWLIVAAIAVATSAVTYLVFERYLTVLLPRGAWTDW
ncbi:MAG: tripartite tricarboxylate transporter TctB family protein [Hyphomicrobiaceae bacterium]